MTVEKDLFDTLKGLVGNRVFPDFAKVETARPYITYQQIGGAVINVLSNEVATKKNSRIQINVWSDSRIEANQLMLAIESAMVTSNLFTSRPESAFIGAYDYDVPVYSCMQDFSVWSVR